MTPPLSGARSTANTIRESRLARAVWLASACGVRMLLSGALIGTVGCARTDPPIDKSELLRRGDAFVEKSQYDEAIAAYRALVEG